MTIATYGTVDLDAIQHEKDELDLERSKSNINYFAFQEGRNVLRILPPWEPTRKSPFHKVWVHYIRNPAQPTKGGRPALCPSKMRNSRCIVCEKVSQLRRSGNDLDKEVAGELSASRQIYANVVDLANPDKGVQVAKFGITIYNELLGYMDPRDPSSLGDLTHPQTGYNLVIERTGKGKNDTRYSVRPSKAPSPLPKMEWLGSMNQLHKINEELTNDAMQALMEGRDPNADVAKEAERKALEAASEPDIGDDTDYLPPRSK